MHRLWKLVDDRLGAPEWPRALLAGIVLGSGCITLSIAADRLAGIDLPFAFALVAIICGAYWNGAVSASVVAVTTLPAAVLLNLTHPFVTPINTAVVLLFSIVLIGFGGHMTSLRRRADAEAQRSRRREVFLQSIFDATPAAMLIADGEGNVVTINESARRILGVDLDRIPNLRLADLLPRFQGKANDTLTFDCSDGRRLTLSASSVMLSLDTTDLQTIYLHDETDTVAAAEQLARLQAELLQLGRATALGQLGSAIAHEINQPLAAAANFAKVARVALERGAPTAEIANPLDDALHHIFGAAAVLKRLREFIQRGPPQAQWVDARKILSESTGIGGMAVRRAHADLEISIAPDLGEVLIDSIQIQQVILNLLSNAAEAVVDAATKKVRLQAMIDAPNRCRITVTDTGPGIAPGFEQDVFVPFRTTKRNGLGVGLSISKSIVKAHGGDIAGATNEGGGATFSFTLPRRAINEGRRHAE